MKNVNRRNTKTSGKVAAKKFKRKKHVETSRIGKKGNDGDNTRKAKKG